MYDLVIIGGGPAGVAAGVYAARKKMSTAMVAQEFGGQSIVSADVQNWIGTPSISGFDLAEALKAHLFVHKESLSIFEGDLVTAIEKSAVGSFKVSLQSGKELETKYVLVASGSRRRRLNVPGEDTFEGKGVVYCSICDAPLFKDKTVAVVGGGNAGLEATIDLLPYAKKIYLIVRSGAPKGDAVTLEKVTAHPNVEIVTNAVTKEIQGETLVTSLAYLDTLTNEVKNLAVDGVFVEIGAVPNTEFVKNVVSLNERGEIIVDHKTQASSTPGIWAAGDASDVLYKQNNISAGDAVKAVLNIYETIVKKS
jgi:alkyl hydroperoxide reductase subunit F